MEEVQKWVRRMPTWSVYRRPRQNQVAHRLYTIRGYEVQFVSAQKGYSGVAIYSKTAWEFDLGLALKNLI